MAAQAIDAEVYPALLDALSLGSDRFLLEPESLFAPADLVAERKRFLAGDETDL